MTFGVALGSALTTLVGGVLFAAVGDMIGWDVLGKVSVTKRESGVSR
jgi:hypothetical protein